MSYCCWVNISTWSDLVSVMLPLGSYLNGLEFASHYKAIFYVCGLRLGSLVTILEGAKFVEVLRRDGALAFRLKLKTKYR